LWPYVTHISRNGPCVQKYQLESHEGEPTDVYVGVRDRVDPRLLDIAHVWLDAQRGVRQGDQGEGRMVGVGKHAPYGCLTDFTTIGDEATHRRVCAGMEVAGGLFHKHFSGKGVGFESMLEQQQRLYEGAGRRAHAWPMHWSCTSNIGNPMHVDHDEARSYAVWICEKPGASRNWWFLFPEHGLAVPLMHGTWISWDGRCVAHCTSVPDVAPGDRLCSLFCSVPAKLCRVLEHEHSCLEALRARSTGSGPRGADLFSMLCQNVRVRYRYTPPPPAHIQSKAALCAWGKTHVQWVPATVVEVCENGVSLKEDSGGKVAFVERRHVTNRVVVVP
jgi:hypothetical protein